MEYLATVEEDYETPWSLLIGCITGDHYYTVLFFPTEEYLATVEEDEFSWGLVIVFVVIVLFSYSLQRSTWPVWKKMSFPGVW